MNLYNIIKFILYFLLLVFLIFLQLSFVNSLAWPWSNINIIFICLFFVVLLVNYRLGLWSAAFIGLIMEIYSPLAFGAIFISLLLSVVLINFLFNLLFTNRALYSLLLLSFLGTVFYYFFNFVYLAVAYRLNLEAYSLTLDNYFVSTIAWQILFTGIILTLIFIPLRLFSKRFKSVYLVGGRR